MEKETVSTDGGDHEENEDMPAWLPIVIGVALLLIGGVLMHFISGS
jgi:hypothetical protein